MTPEQGFTYSMSLEVYLEAASVRGVLTTNQDRLSNFLIVREGEEVFSLTQASLETLNQKPVSVTAAEYLVYMREVYLIADLSVSGEGSTSTMRSRYVRKDQSKALLGVGPYLLQGSIHLRPGSAMCDLLMEKTQFLPVTGAILIDRPDVAPRTYLVNRAKIGFMSAVGDGLVEL
jgi:hypothetical protein